MYLDVPRHGNSFQVDDDHDEPCTIREDMPRNVNLVTRFASHVTEDELRTSMANSSNWINAEKQLEKQRSPVIPSG